MSPRDPLTEALDRFDVPAITAGLSERIMAAVTTRSAPRRDRRGLWRRGRQVAFGVAAFGMLSAAAVASGLLGKVGIEVPVLTAMLAPEPMIAPKHRVALVAKHLPKPRGAVPAPPPAVETLVTPPPLAVADRIQLRAERRERIATFVAQHPRAAAVIAQRVGQQLRQREKVRREALGLPPANPAAPDFRPLTPDERFLLRQERRRDFRRAEAIFDRRIARREAWRAIRDGDGPAAVGLSNAVSSREGQSRLPR